MDTNIAVPGIATVSDAAPGTTPSATPGATLGIAPGHMAPQPRTATREAPAWFDLGLDPHSCQEAVRSGYEGSHDQAVISLDARYHRRRFPLTVSRRLFHARMNGSDSPVAAMSPSLTTQCFPGPSIIARGAPHSTQSLVAALSRRTRPGACLPGIVNEQTACVWIGNHCHPSRRERFILVAKRLTGPTGLRLSRQPRGSRPQPHPCRLHPRGSVRRGQVAQPLLRGHVPRGQRRYREVVWIHHPPGYDPTHSPARVLRIALSARHQMHVAVHHGLPGSLPRVHADVESENGWVWHGEKEVASRPKTWVARDASARRRTPEGLKWLPWVRVWNALEGTPEGSCAPTDRVPGGRGRCPEVRLD